MVTNKDREASVIACEPVTGQADQDVLRAGPPLCWWETHLLLLIKGYRDQIKREELMCKEASSHFSLSYLAKELKHTILEKELFVEKLEELRRFANAYKPDI